MNKVFKVGIGYDVHRLEEEEVFILGGINIPFNKGLAEGVSAGTFFSYRDQNLLQTRHQVSNSGSLVRTLK